MPGLVPGIHDVDARWRCGSKTWMAGSSPAMTDRAEFQTETLPTTHVAQHFLLSARARTLSLKAICRMSDDEAHATFVVIRFAANARRAIQNGVRARPQAP